MAGKEAERLAQGYSATSNATPWMFWGPYLSERQWGTVREDYSEYGTAWSYLPHDHARSRAYRWGEDGLAGFSDENQRLCFALALWNGADPILKERLFGLTNDEGNHGEDVKEYYFYLDSTPTHSYMKWLYKYPQRAFPYADLVRENARRRGAEPYAFEYELLDTGVFEGDRYFEVQVEYAKAGPEDILIKVRITNRGPDAAALHVLPTLWFRNIWSWTAGTAKPTLKGQLAAAPGVSTIRAEHPEVGAMTLYCETPDALLFVENETNAPRVFGAGASSNTPYPKDGINDHVIHGSATVNPDLTGTKAAALHRLQIEPGQTVEVRLRLSRDAALAAPFGADFDATFGQRIAEADEFYAAVGPATLSDEQRAVQRQAYAGMLWSKQFYNYVVIDWLEGDPAYPPPPATRLQGRNANWNHFYASNVLSMPDAWEYPWFAAWDLCFQAVVMARVDLQFAKNQLMILAREWYMSPDGEIPAYEWAFSDVNPPLHAWAALRIYRLERELTGKVDGLFLAGIFKYCLMYFTWWTNRKDADGNNLFSGGFLGLDNIGLFDRKALRNGAQLYQSDGTSWMGMFCLNMLDAASELVVSREEAEYSRLAVKFFQHFVYIADAMNGGHGPQGDVNLWDDADGFYYDVLRTADGGHMSIKMRSLVGIMALYPVLMLDLTEPGVGTLSKPLQERLEWFLSNHSELMKKANPLQQAEGHWLLSFVTPDRLRQILVRVLDEREFLGPHGVRGISRVYADHPYDLAVDSASIDGNTQPVRYQPAESPSGLGLMGGNSNWRGPVWFPVNFLLIEALLGFHRYLGDDFKVECPVGSGRQLTLREVATELGRRLTSIFQRDDRGNRPVYGGAQRFQQDPHWRDLVLFYEYFNGDNGAGVGASHQTGWTGLVAELLRGV
jgi:hypothetical protein